MSLLVNNAQENWVRNHHDIKDRINELQLKKMEAVDACKVLLRQLDVEVVDSNETLTILQFAIPLIGLQGSSSSSLFQQQQRLRDDHEYHEISSKKMLLETCSAQLAAAKAKLQLLGNEKVKIMNCRKTQRLACIHTL